MFVLFLPVPFVSRALLVVGALFAGGSRIAVSKYYRVHDLDTDSRRRPAIDDLLMPIKILAIYCDPKDSSQ